MRANANEQTIRPAVVLRCREVLRRTGLSRATLYRLMAKGKFPQQHPLSEGTVGWSEKEVEKWIDERMENKGPVEGPSADGDGAGAGP